MFSWKICVMGKGEEIYFMKGSCFDLMPCVIGYRFVGNSSYMQTGQHGMPQMGPRGLAGCESEIEKYMRWGLARLLQQRFSSNALFYVSVRLTAQGKHSG